jgi:hypothetical protein
MQFAGPVELQQAGAADGLAGDEHDSAAFHEDARSRSMLSGGRRHDL